MTLRELAERVPGCTVAAWIDARTGAVLARHAARDDGGVELVLETVIEIVRSPERPPHTVLLAPQQVYLARRSPRDPHRVIVVACARSPNLGLAVALVHAAADAGEEAA